MRIGSLFSGIGGLELGLEWAGVGHTVWHCETDPYASKVLARHWPGVPNLGDITTVDWSTVENVEVICGGFPCQDISLAGRGGGLAGERSGLWRHYVRAVRHLRPRYVVVENVAALLARGLGDVLGDLAACGYDTEWDCIPAAAVGAPHRRDRLFVVAYTSGPRRRQDPRSALGDEAPHEGRAAQHDHVADGDGESRGRRQWAVEPALGRVADGIPNRVDRLRALGNAVVPQVAEVIGRRIMEIHAEQTAATPRAS